ncbi:MAG: CmcI family methyltransferase [bacterium]
MSKFQLLFKNPEKFIRLVREHLNVHGKFAHIKRPEYQPRFSKTLSEWVIHHQNEILTKQVTWMGVPIWKNVLDLHIYQEIVFEQSPDFIVEIGTAYGGCALYLAYLCDILNKGTVVTIDVDHAECVAEHKRIIKITGKSQNPQVVEQVHRMVKASSALVIQDGDHSAEMVLQDLNNYADLVPVGSYFIVEDTIADVFNNGNGVGRSIDGPLCAVERFLAENTHFVVDKNRERYLITQNPGGYLKRIL